MVQFGKRLLETRYEPWAEHYLDYMGLKKCLKTTKKHSKPKKRRSSFAATLPAPFEEELHPPPPPPPPLPPQSISGGEDELGRTEASPIGSPQFEQHPQQPPTPSTPGSTHTTASNDTTTTTAAAAAAAVVVTKSFETMLEAEVEKIGLFFLQIQGELATELAVLRHHVSSPLLFHLQDLYTAYHAVAVLLLRLIRYVESNVTGIRKILKKHDKITKKHLTAEFIFPRVENRFRGYGKSNKKSLLTNGPASLPTINDYNNSDGSGNEHRELKHLWSDMLLRQYQGIRALEMTLQMASSELKQLERQRQHRNKLEHQHQQHYRSLSDARIDAGLLINRDQHPINEPNSNLDQRTKPPRPVPSKSGGRHVAHQSVPNVVLTLQDLADSAKIKSPSANNNYNNSTVTSSKKSYGTASPHTTTTTTTTTTTMTGLSATKNSQTSHQEITAQELDTMLLKVEAARRRLNASSNTFQNLLAAQIIMLEPDMMVPDDELLGDEDEDELLRQAKSIEEKWLSHFLNLTSTFLYITNYYVVAPTSGHYAKMLGGNEALAGIIIGMTPIAALVSTILYSWWTSYSFKAALLFASTCSILGNIFYALALPCNSLTMVMVGRLLNGFGSARSINRRYIADTFPPRQRTAESANFVTAGALGMAAGPALASLLHIGSPDNDFREGFVHKHTEETIYEINQSPITVVTDDDHILFNNRNVWWTPENAPGWFMLVVWSIFLVLLWLHFEDPPKRKTPPKVIENDVESAQTGAIGEKQSLLQSTKRDSTSDDDDDDVDSEIPIWRNIPVMTTFVIYFVLKLILECLLSSTATLTSFYFNWDSGISGIYLAILGLLMLPANFVVAILASRHDDRELIVGCEVAMLLGCCGILQFTDRESYTAVQYVLFSVVIFLSTNALEGPNMSLLSKTIPKSWSLGFFNVGLLATEAGTLGRAVGDMLLSVLGYRGLDTLLNSAFRWMSISSGFCLAVTLCFFDYMEPHEKDD